MNGAVWQVWADRTGVSWVLGAANQRLGVTIISWLECDRQFESGIAKNRDDGNPRRCASEQIVKMDLTTQPDPREVRYD
jgi:hypothetical protein